MKQYTATANDEGVRLSRFVQSVTRDFPTSLLYKSFRNKRIKVNGKKGVPEDRIKAGDLIELYINDEYFEQVREEEAFRRMGYQATFVTIDWEEKKEKCFQGQWLVCDFGKELSGEVRLSENAKKLRRQHRSDSVEMENPAFNDRFLVTAASAQEAYYLLTPHMMEYILSAAGRSGGEVYMAFLRGGKLLLHLASLLHHLLHVHTGHDGSFTCGRATSCKGSRSATGLSNSKIVPRRGASKRGGHATSVDIHVLERDARPRLCKVELCKVA